MSEQWLSETVSSVVEGADLIRRMVALYRDIGVKPNDGSARGAVLADMEDWLRRGGLYP